MNSKLSILALSMGLLLACIAGCEGPEGPAGAPGTPGEPTQQYTYLGDDINACNHCHGETVTTWSATAHPGAYAALVAAGSQNNLYCVQCHVTGFDATVSYGDSVINTPGPDLSGWDDYWPAGNEEDSLRLVHLEGVQCEACHGPMGPTIYDHAPTMNFYTGTIDDPEPSMCAKCHEQVEEWQESGHGMVLETHSMTLEEFNDEWNGSNTCAPCHTGDGFAEANDPYWTAAGRSEEAHLIGCQACHDPHEDANEAQLRNLDPYTVIYDVENAATFQGYGTAQTCVQCHHARRSVSNVEGQIANGYAHFGPHGSPQMDMFVGSGSYEIDGYTYDRDHTHQALSKSCVTCHMTTREHSDPLGWKGGHDFEASVAACQGCHPDLTTEGVFDHGGGQTEIEDLMGQLLAAIGVPEDSLGSATATTVEQRMAGYAYAFVQSDGSRGVHNPAYAKALLENALAFLATSSSTYAQNSRK
ncbi:MAG: multiheme c-type cytochrome [bacterium]